MFVSAPYLPGNGSASWTTFARVATHWSMSLSVTRSLMTSWNNTYASTYATRHRANCLRGVIGPKLYINTPYISECVRYSSSGHAHVIWSPTWQLTRFDGRGYEAFGIGYHGGHSSGQGWPHSIYNWDSINSNPRHVANRLMTLNLRNRVENEARLKLADLKMDLSELLIDIDSTVGLVARRASQILTAWRQVRAGQFRRAARTLGISKRNFRARTAAELWLELQYGWKPLLADIHTAIELHTSKKPDRPIEFTVTRRGTQALSGLGDLAGDWDTLGRGGRIAAYVETKYRARLSDAETAWYSSMGLDNPLYVKWISMPFSFVVDWLAPVGDWLRGMTAHRGLTFVSGYTSVKVAGTVSVTGRIRPPSSGAVVRENSGQMELSVSYNRLRRYPHSDFGTPIPYFRFPVSTLTRAASAAALLEVTLNENRRR